MKIGTVVRVKRAGQEPRDLMYAGFVGKIVHIRPGPNKDDSECFVDSDAAGKIQAVSFKHWFSAEELESIEGESEMSYPTFHSFCDTAPQTSITVSGANGNDMPPDELRGLVGTLNNQPSVDEVAEAIYDGDEDWDKMPTQAKEEYRADATRLLTKYFIRQALNEVAAKARK